VSESAIDDFELERRQPSAITADAIRRALEDVGVVFLPQDDVQLRSDVSAPRERASAAAVPAAPPRVEAVPGAPSFARAPIAAVR
jgi:hypothetical protein